jgi:bifunctional non-homologous end joining protein LigD
VAYTFSVRTIGSTGSIKIQQLREAVKAQGLEGVIAKRRDSFYEPGRRSGAWVKMQVNKSRDLVVGGYVANGKNFDSIVVNCRQGARGRAQGSNQGL